MYTYVYIYIYIYIFIYVHILRTAMAILTGFKSPSPNKDGPFHIFSQLMFHELFAFRMISGSGRTEHVLGVLE